ncbi:hypothetical protein LDENG_00288200 [Lucifuga dentata]|nr:hypothetical protein LDENG_00288200 [Lucifuga dentata]
MCVWFSSCRKESAPEGRHHCSEDHRLPSTFPGGLVLFSLPQEGKDHSQGRISSRTLTF